MVPSEDKKSCICAIGKYLVAPSQTCEACPYDCLTCNGNQCLTCDTIPPTSMRTLNTQTKRCECPAVGYFDDKISQRTCIKCNFRCRTCSGPEVTQC